VLKTLQGKVRHRLAARDLVAPAEPDPAYFSRFRGLWTDRRDADEEIGRRLEAGRIDEADADRLRHWIAHGYVILERGVKPEVCDRLRGDLDRAFADGDERLLMFPPQTRDPQPLTAGQDTERARVVDVYAFYESARAALFSDAIVRFLRIIFDDTPVLFQSLTFETGSQQALHLDTQFVVTSSPLEFAASWIALEDIQPGSGELMYLDGSHRVPEYLFSGKYKNWSEKRDGEAQAAEWRSQLEHHAKRMGLEEKRFLPPKGDVLIWSADLAHGGSPVADASLTRNSLVGHYCPNRVTPFYFRVQPDRRGKAGYEESLYASQYYPVGT
jgi:hypothetical protein